MSLKRCLNAALGEMTRVRGEARNSTRDSEAGATEGPAFAKVAPRIHALPVVAFDCPTGPADVVDDGVDGILAPPEDAGGLADGILHLIDDPPLRRRMGSAALRTAAAYGPDAVNPHWEFFFAELLAEAG